jgi:hypothetical protein
MGALNAITNVYATLRTTAGLKQMWGIALVADALMLLLLSPSLLQFVEGKLPGKQLLPVLVGIALLAGKAYVESVAYRLIKELPRVPIKEVQALSNLNILARIWAVCFLTVGSILAINLAAVIGLVVAMVVGILGGLFAWFFLGIGYFKFIEALISPFLGFFKTETKLLTILHIDPEAALVVGCLTFTGLFLAPLLFALIVISRRSRLHEGSAPRE